MTVSKVAQTALQLPPIWPILSKSTANDTMRKIETQMNAAITNGKCWKSDNTEVFTNDNNASLVYLHGNLIAIITDNSITMFDGGWQTNTTKSRLNAILSEHGIDGEYIYQKAGTWYLNMKNAKGEDLQVPFFSGMRLNWIILEILLF